MKAESATARKIRNHRPLEANPQDVALRGRYLYAVVSAAAARDYGPWGINGGLVYPLAHGPVAALVSDVPPQRIRPERANLAAHQLVLKRLQEAGAMLPISFGVIANSDRDIRKILARHQVVLVKQLHRLAGKVEMGLRVDWEVPNIFEYFVSSHPELRVLRDEFFGPNREATQENKIEIGRLFERLLHEDREACAEQVEEIIAPCCFESKRNRCRQEREVLNLACLVGREPEAQARFEAGVFEAASRFDHNFAFDYSGPWPAASFVNLNLKP
ncbi:MAG: GvpL/GvpF family gas vesicle protein [Desulfobaccales bacterium]